MRVDCKCVPSLQLSAQYSVAKLVVKYTGLHFSGHYFRLIMLSNLLMAVVEF